MRVMSLEPSWDLKSCCWGIGDISGGCSGLAEGVGDGCGGGDGVQNEMGHLGLSVCQFRLSECLRELCGRSLCGGRSLWTSWVHGTCR